MMFERYRMALQSSMNDQTTEAETRHYPDASQFDKSSEPLRVKTSGSVAPKTRNGIVGSQVIGRRDRKQSPNSPRTPNSYDDNITEEIKDVVLDGDEFLPMIFSDWMAPGRKPEETKEILSDNLENITKQFGKFP